MQYDYISSFQTVAATVADVALNFGDNLSQAYKEHTAELGVTRQSFYAKTRSVEPAVSESLVSHSGDRTIEMQEALGFVPWELLPGYRCLSMDGNALAKSDKRLKVLQESKGAPRPGKIVARFDSQRQIFDRSYVLLDGHSQESTCCDRIVDDLKANDVVIADRHYCIVSFLSKIAEANGYFAILQQGRLKGWFRCSQRSLATSTLVNIVNPDSALRRKQHRSRNVQSSHVSTAKMLGLVELDTLTPPGQLACRIRLRS